jgi:hypothetical protein
MPLSFMEQEILELISMLRAHAIGKVELPVEKINRIIEILSTLKKCE